MTAGKAIASCVVISQSCPLNCNCLFSWSLTDNHTSAGIPHKVYFLPMEATVSYRFYHRRQAVFWTNINLPCAITCFSVIVQLLWCYVHNSLNSGSCQAVSTPAWKWACYLCIPILASVLGCVEIEISLTTSNMGLHRTQVRCTYFLHSPCKKPRAVKSVFQSRDHYESLHILWNNDATCKVSIVMAKFNPKCYLTWISAISSTYGVGVGVLKSMLGPGVEGVVRRPGRRGRWRLFWLPPPPPPPKSIFCNFAAERRRDKAQGHRWSSYTGQWTSWSKTGVHHGPERIPYNTHVCQSFLIPKKWQTPRL